MKIIYEQEDKKIAIMAVSGKYADSDLVSVGKKFVPKNRPFLIIDDSSVPKDDTFFEAWEADFSKADGIGESE